MIIQKVTKMLQLVVWFLEVLPKCVHILDACCDKDVIFATPNPFVLTNEVF